jgi:hypothetical protein
MQRMSLDWQKGQGSHVPAVGVGWIVQPCAAGSLVDSFHPPRPPFPAGGGR